MIRLAVLLAVFVTAGAARAMPPGAAAIEGLAAPVLAEQAYTSVRGLIYAQARQQALLARRQERREARAACRAEAAGLRGHARRAAVDACFAARQPVAAREQNCRREARSRGVPPRTPEHRAYMRECAFRA